MFKNIFGIGNKSAKRTRASRQPNSKSDLTFQSLEPRRLLTGIFFDSATNTVTLAGGAGDDAGSFLQSDSSTYRATLLGAGSRQFAVSDVDRVIFIGFGGDDVFNNGSDVEGLLLGGNGNDTLRGGSQRDVINGGNGNDDLFGNEGLDRIIGGFGDDEIRGGTGNDQIFAGDGTNRVFGEGGDDLIFGGSDVDRIFGGTGSDQIFGLDGNDVLSAGNGGIAGTLGVTQADLVLGQGGDDFISGGTGLNVFYGGSGNDTLLGGSGENRLHGQNGNDELTGGSSADFIAGHLGNDTLIGNAGNDFILPGQGNDTVDAGLGVDFVEFGLNFGSYTLNASEIRLISEHVVEGIDTIDNSERLRFSDGQRLASDQIRQRVVVQPIVVANDNGSNQAEFFGTAAQQAFIVAEIDRIFAVAGVDIEWLETNHYNSTRANTGNVSGNTARLRQDLGTILSEGDAAGVGSADPLVIDAYFVEVAAGFRDVGESTANGLALIGEGGTTIHVGDNLLDSEEGLMTIAAVTAHEIGHNLGLGHVNDLSNLLGQGTDLNQSQISTIADSQLAQNVPCSNDTTCQCGNCLQVI